MELANPLAYYDTVTITAVKSLIIQVRGIEASQAAALLAV
jgi:hypothetical protein